MLLLGIESSTPRSSVALVGEDRVLAAAVLNGPQRHGEFLGPAIDFCLTQAGREPADVTGVAVGTGPGLFTGLRVGIMTAQTFAAARNLPMVGISGLDVLAFRFRHSRRMLCTVLDARRREVYWAFYRCAPGGVQRATETRLGSMEKLLGEIEGLEEQVLVLGDAQDAHAEEFARVNESVAVFRDARPDAADLAQLARPRFIREETQRPGEIQPIYLRGIDAKIGWETRGRLHGGGS